MVVKETVKYNDPKGTDPTRGIEPRAQIAQENDRSNEQGE